MFIVVREYDVRYGDVVDETFYRTLDKAREKVAELIKTNYENHPDLYEDMLDADFDGSLNTYIDWVVEDNGEDEGVVTLEWFDFEEDKEKR